MSRKNIIEIIKLIQAGLTQDDYGKSRKRFDDLVKELEKPITLVDFLGWEDDVEYECYDDKFIIMDNQLYIWNYTKRDWIDAYSVSINRVEQLRQAKKVKKKAYHVKDDYSYNCLMKELEEQGFNMNFKNNPFSFEGEIYIWEEKNNKLGFSIIKLNKILEKYDLIEYHKEEPKYYAKVKGWELVDSSDIYWNRYDGYPNLVINNTRESKGYTIKLTKSEWNNLGINESNADFEEVGE